MIRNTRSATTALALTAALTFGAALPLAAPPAKASGGSDTLSEARDHADYEQGKAVVRNELGAMPASGDEAREMLQSLRSGEIGGDLSEEDRRAAQTYLERRWQLN